MWVELFRTRHYDGAFSMLGLRRHDFVEIEEPVRVGRHKACSAYRSLDGRYRIVADVDRRGRSVRIVQARAAGPPG